RFSDPRAAAGLVRKIAQAVHYAHGKGILHRDLKPANVLLDENGEPRVSDFGLAKLMDDIAPAVAETEDAGMELTELGQRVGTPAYMAPEQAAGRNDLVGPATDVWALGAILYELLTGRRPFAAPDKDELARLIQTQDPARPCAQRPELDEGLERVVLKCLEKTPVQ